MEIKKDKCFPDRFGVAKIILIGLVAAQFISTCHVYFSNISFYESMHWLSKAGYITVPNAKTLWMAKTFISAFSGGLFFTLTLGCFISLVSLVFVLIWLRLFKKGKWGLLPGLVVWFLSIWLVNKDGFLPVESAYFLFIPLVVIGLTLKWGPKEHVRMKVRDIGIYFLPFLLLVVLAVIKIDNQLFMDFRDNILLSNPIGIKVNDFYYKYTLFPAEIFKPYEKKLIKTCCLENIETKRLTYRLEKMLLRFDYLPLSTPPSDMTVSQSKNMFIMKHKDKAVVTVDQTAFFKSPYTYLKAFSDQTDAYWFFRRVTGVSLVIGLPVCVYIFVFGIIQFICLFFTTRRSASMLASVGCLILGLAMMFFLQANRYSKDDTRSLAELLTSGNSFHRTAAIREILKKRADITQYPISEINIKSAYMPERYWLAMALRDHPNKTAEKFLLELMRDPSANVKCKAYAGLAKTKNRSYIPLLLRELKRSDHLYAQLYAYNALKELGWTQTKPR